MSRVEEILKTLSADGEPLSRVEAILLNKLGYDVEMPEPVSRVEILLSELKISKQ